MKLKKIRLKLEELINSEGHKRRKKIHKIETLLEKLEQREKKLKKRYTSHNSDIDRQAIDEELEVVRKQKHKGKKALKEIDSGSH